MNIKGSICYVCFPLAFLFLVAVSLYSKSADRWSRALKQRTIIVSEHSRPADTHPNTTQASPSSSFQLPSTCKQARAADRLTVLENWCTDNGFTYEPATKQRTLFLKELTNIHVDDKYKVVYCHIPKTGCTNWKKYFILMSGRTDYSRVQQIKGSDAHSTLFSNSVRTLSSYNESERGRILDTYYKFIFVRHPLTRLLSAYRNKFEHRNPTFEWFTQKILRYNNHKPSENHDTAATLPEFLRYITDPEARNIHSNEHWYTYHDLCHPCTIKYDFIGHVETMTEDVRHVIAEIGAPYSFPERQSSSDQYVEAAYSNISKTLTARVIQKYSDDFHAFGYNC